MFFLHEQSKFDTSCAETHAMQMKNKNSKPTFILTIAAFFLTAGNWTMADCGYVFTKGPDAWKALPNNWSCPPCGSVKRRFKKVPKGSVKDTSGAVPAKKKGPFGF